MEIIIDKIAIWKANLSGKFTVREMPIGTRYLDETAGLYVMSDKILYRYAKNYKKGKTEFCLFVRTYRDDKVKIETELDAVAKTITEEYAKKINNLATVKDFEYLNEKLKGNN